MPKPLIFHSPLTGRYYISTRYTVKEGHVVTHTKTDVTDQVEAILESYKQQRDALLAACKAQEAFDNHATECGDCQEGCHCVVGSELSLKAQDLRSAALAKVEGQA